ncbi:lipopolysaccharide biosynthesis protein [Segatella bryantii]|uniref:lipopolysaccharide biosynthesis protein n=1 Tax=Segatella bryantii TaxID=77095 RepID=UPI00241D019E|nr:lipopolysaccharide biosynthesis protein [Segatella bryantii]
MILLLIIQLYTSRVILKNLGVEDYGIYNVVGGFVLMFSFLNSSMAGATQRFLNFDMVNNDEDELHNTFCSSVMIHLFIAILLLIFAETFGLWFLQNKMTIPDNRMEAALWVYHSSVFSMLLTIWSSPYNAAIIAHERMSAFAYISIAEATLKLLVVFVLSLTKFDKLILYALLMLGISSIIRIIYGGYCRRHFYETKFTWVWQPNKIKEMGAFASWNLLGNVALMSVTQGLNVILNLFFIPAINAARGISIQVQASISQISQNFQVAVNPQIVKSYANKEYGYMHELIFISARFSFYLLYFFALPFFFVAQQILDLWLITPPAYTADFIRIILITALVNVISNPLDVSVGATGKIKHYQVLNSFFLIICIPVSYIILLYIKSPLIVFLVQLFMTTCTHFIKLYMSYKKTKLLISDFFRQVYLKIVAVLIFSISLPLVLYYYLEESMTRNIALIFVCFITNVTAIYWVGLKKEERSFILKKISKKKFYEFSKK